MLPKHGLPIDYDEGLLQELRRVYGSSLTVFLESLLKPPARYYLRVNRRKARVEDVVETIESMGWRVYVDEVVEEAVWIPVEEIMQHQQLESIECRVLVDKRAAESVMVGAHVYAPGVVGFEGDCKPGVEALVVFEGTRRPVALGKLVDIEAVERGKGLVVENVAPLYRLPSFRETKLYSKGIIYEQSLPSILVGRVAVEGVKPRLVVDMCAAPGGKTTHVAELLAGGGVRILAFDHSRRKVEKLKEEVSRLGHNDVVEVYRADSRYLDRDYPSLVGKVDLVILDPPCTSIGVIPKVYDSKTLRDVINASRYQRQFLRVAAKLLKPCGVLVYSTCTVTVAENEDNVIYAVEELKLSVEYAWPRHPHSGIGVELREAIRFHPHVHGLPGYFIARLRKPC